MTYQYIHLGYLDTVAGEDQQLRRTLLEMVQEELASAVPEMVQAYDSHNWEELHGIVHKLKSTLAFVGNPDLIRINQNILSHLEERNYSADFATWLSEYNHLYGPVRIELKQELEN
jgi:HPt (histidine-containing phosphotransfer) domain-containing protein